MSLLDLFKSKATRAKEEKAKQDRYVADLGKPEILKKLIGFLSPQTCKVLSTKAIALKNEYLPKFDAFSNDKDKLLEATLAAAVLDRNELGLSEYRLKKTEVLLGEMAKQETIKQIDELRNKIAPLLVLDAIRHHPKMKMDILLALHHRGKEGVNIPAVKKVSNQGRG